MELSEIKGIGAATIEKLAALNITSVYGLVSFLPSKYVDLKLPLPALDAEAGQFCLFEGEVISSTLPSKRGTRSFTVTFRDSVAAKRTAFKAVFFNQPYYASTFEAGKKFRLLAKTDYNSNSILLVNPIFEASDKIKLLDGIYTVYALKGEIGQKTFKNLLSSTFSLLASRSEGQFATQYLETLRLAHFPRNADECESSLSELSAIDLACGLSEYQKVRKSSSKPRKVFYNCNDFRILDVKSALKLNLTASQNTAIDSIEKDLKSGSNMSRIVSGDVGSGKSLVAYAAISLAANGGKQAVYMAPTEILAAQQYSKFLGVADDLGLKTALLTSSTTGIERAAILEGARTGELNVLFGTQSLLNDDLQFDRLSLAVIDEQHKFGVKDRATLENKGAVDVLTLTATPIPRTLAMTLYDGIDVSTIEKREEARTNISTKIISDAKTSNLLTYVKNECASGKQAFIVCPSICDSEGLELYSIELFEKDFLPLLGNLNVSILTGKMKAEEKSSAMREFSERRTDVLVATSVIEVGIDTKASIIAVMNADRFGLASLHQLRGRVGRDGSPAYCFLHTKNPTDRALERLTALEKYSDGITLAEKDLAMRGGGQILGAKQSGATVSPWLKLPISVIELKRAKEISSSDICGEAGDFMRLLGADYSAFVSSLENVTLNS